jgi:hypothetical protein
MTRWLMVGLAAALAAYGQRIETQKADRTRITRVETALNHLTVIEVGDSVEQVATGSTSFKVEWRGNRVFVQPLEPDAATNLFIWTRSSRLSYELVPAGSVEKMHFAIDEEPTITAVAAAPPAPAVVEKPPIPSEMLYRSQPVRLVGTPGQRPSVDVLLRDLYEKDGKVYLRYAIRNAGTGTYEPRDPAIVRLKSPRATQSLYGMHRTQLADNLARRIVAKGSESVHVVHSEIEGSVIAPGKLAVGFLAFDAPQSEGPTVLQLRFPMDRGWTVTATIVL